MHRVVMLILLLGIGLSLFAQRGERWDWANGIGGTGQERCFDNCTDLDGNVISVGDFTDTLLVNGSVYTSAGQTDIFISKHNFYGNLDWIKTFGGTGSEVGIGVDTDSAGNIYVTGYFTEQLQIGNVSLTSLGSWDVFAIKLSYDGRVIWAKQESTSRLEVGYGIAVTDQGEAYVTGWYVDQLDLHNNTSLLSHGGGEIFIIKYDTNGDILWADTAGSASEDYGFTVGVDTAGSCYINGIQSGNSIFGDDGLLTPGMFVAKWNTNGVFQWVRGGDNAGGTSVAVSPSGNAYTIGRISAPCQVGDISISEVNGPDDILITCLDTNGNWQWAKTIGGNGSDRGRDIYVDSNENVFIAATWDDTLTVNETSAVSQGGTDMLIGQLNSSGGLEWFKLEGKQYDEVVSSICKGEGSRVFVSGWYLGESQFGNHSITAAYESDMNYFVASLLYNVCANDDAIVVTTCKAYPNPFVNAVTIQVSGDLKSDVVGTIYNVKGQRIRDLHSLKSSDQVIYQWDGLDSRGRACSAGIYFFKNQGDRPHIKKLLKL